MSKKQNFGFQAAVVYYLKILSFHLQFLSELEIFAHFTTFSFLLLTVLLPSCDLLGPCAMFFVFCPPAMALNTYTSA